MHTVDGEKIVKGKTPTVIREINRLCITRDPVSVGLFMVWTPRKGKCLKYGIELEEAISFCQKTIDYVSVKLSDESISYLEKAMGKENVDKELLFRIGRHIRRYQMFNSNDPCDVCAYYTDWKDFCSEWCDYCGYSRKEARSLLHNKKGEFMILPARKGIIRFAI